MAIHLERSIEECRRSYLNFTASTKDCEPEDGICKDMTLMTFHRRLWIWVRIGFRIGAMNWMLVFDLRTNFNLDTCSLHFADQKITVFRNALLTFRDYAEKSHQAEIKKWHDKITNNMTCECNFQCDLSVFVCHIRVCCFALTTKKKRNNSNKNVIWNGAFIVTSFAHHCQTSRQKNCHGTKDTYDGNRETISEHDQRTLFN